MNEIIDELYDKIDVRDEIIKEQIKELSEANQKLEKIKRIVETLKQSCRYNSHLYELDYIIDIIVGEKPVSTIDDLVKEISEGKTKVNITEDLYEYLKKRIPTEKRGDAIASFYGIKLNVVKE